MHDNLNDWRQTASRIQTRATAVLTALDALVRVASETDATLTEIIAGRTDGDSGVKRIRTLAEIDSERLAHDKVVVAALSAKRAGNDLEVEAHAFKIYKGGKVANTHDAAVRSCVSDLRQRRETVETKAIRKDLASVLATRATLAALAEGNPEVYSLAVAGLDSRIEALKASIDTATATA